LGIEAALLKLIACPDLCSRAWITDQYDSTVGGQTVKRPGAADAAVVRIEGTKRALALTTDCTPRYCQADPRAGGAQAVAEAWRNLTAVGARPLAVTDNLNFGNPEKPEIMGQFAASVLGMAEACRALDFPVVSGNVSLYNETQGTGILPTPAIGGLGVLDDAATAVGLAPTAGDTILLVGHTAGHLGQSLWLREIAGQEAGAPPPVDLAAERRNGDFVRGAILAGRITACHDLSDGGLLVALAEIAMAGPVGISVTAAAPPGLPAHGWWFGEDQARYLAATQNPAALLREAGAAGIPLAVIGRAESSGLTLPGGVTISAAKLHEAHDRFFPAWMNAA
jgi:phosphoribosylformylglycinamidine synthase